MLIAYHKSMLNLILNLLTVALQISFQIILYNLYAASIFAILTRVNRLLVDNG